MSWETCAFCGRTFHLNRPLDAPKLPDKVYCTPKCWDAGKAADRLGITMVPAGTPDPVKNKPE